MPSQPIFLSVSIQCFEYLLAAIKTAYGTLLEFNACLEICGLSFGVQTILQSSSVKLLWDIGR